MKYTSTSELPPTIRDVLPPAAQTYYIEVYNESLEMELNTKDMSLSRESIAHQLAWDAVNREFVHDSHTGQWYRKGEEPTEEEVESQGLFARIRNIF